MKLILNERTELETILKTGAIPKDCSKRTLITMLAKYYKSDFPCAETLADKVRETMRIFRLPAAEYQEYKWFPVILSICGNVTERDARLRELEYIPLYQSEWNNILLCDTDRQKKLLFTLYAAARFMDCGGWVNLEWKYLFGLANISVSLDMQISFLQYMKDKGFISLSRMNDNLNINVKQGEQDCILLKITSLENLGNQFIIHYKDGYKLCECCQKPFRKKSNNAKYCKKCAPIRNIQKTSENNSRKRTKI